MFECKDCNFETEYKYNWNRHVKTKRHIRKQQEQQMKKEMDLSHNDDISKVKLQHAQLKKEMKYKTKLKLSQKDTELAELKIKLVEIKSELLLKNNELSQKNNELSQKDAEILLLKEKLSKYVDEAGSARCFYEPNNDELDDKSENSISKKNYMNLHFNRAIDFDTFIENFKNKKPLTSEQTKILLEKYNESGYLSIAKDLYEFLVQNYCEQIYDITHTKIDIPLLPFVKTDYKYRTHLEKTIGGWEYVKPIDRIKKLVMLSNDMINKHHNKFIPMSTKQRKRLVGSLLIHSTYSQCEVSMDKIIELKINKIN